MPTRSDHANAPMIVALLTILVSAAVIATGQMAFGGTETAATDEQSVAELPQSDEVESIVAAVDDTPAEAEAGAGEVRSVDLGGCQVSDSWLTMGEAGESVECVQKALYAAGTYDGEFHGDFDAATNRAVRDFQKANELFVDGVVGGETAEALGVWPGDESFVVRTPAPPPGAVDLLGYPLSSVASVGSDAPEMPANTGQGTGKRIVYSRTEQRVWAVDDEERVVRSYLVTGSQYANEVPGTHRVYSRSETTTAWNGEADLPYMVRWLKTERGAIGFHAIPLERSTGEPYQTEAELGRKDSGGCQRQADADAWFMWNFGEIGTRVIVV